MKNKDFITGISTLLSIAFGEFWAVRLSIGDLGHVFNWTTFSLLTVVALGLGCIAAVVADGVTE